jgi:dinuclear metal center YbgI/SA1388 family protein
MLIADILSYLETLAPPAYQEPYDNVGLLVGNKLWPCTGVTCTLDVTEEVVKEAIAKKTNLVVAHHPLIFKGLKSITGGTDAERAIITAIKHDIAIYAIHTNLDNVIQGVSGKMGRVLGLQEVTVLAPRPAVLKKLYSFVPVSHADRVRDAIFLAGGGQIGRYSECSFNTEGTGSFKAGEGTDPFIGKIGVRELQPETRIEVIFPAWLEKQVVRAMKLAHPYEEVAYDIVALSNEYQEVGSGILGLMPKEMDEKEVLEKVKKVFGAGVIRYSPLLGRKVKKLALCGGSGSFLVGAAIAAGADMFITGDIKYHDFFEAEARIVMVDIGHFESERFTIDLLAEILEEKFLNFAVLKTGVITNPVNYF